MEILNKMARKLFKTTRLLWDSSNGTAMRVEDDKGNVRYVAKPKVGKVKKQLTEAQDNAIGRALRRRSNRHMRGWLPHAQR